LKLLSPRAETEPAQLGHELVDSEEAEKISPALAEKRQELINLAEQTLSKEKEITELQRQLAQIERAQIEKRYEEKLELVALILQDLKSR